MNKFGMILDGLCGISAKIDIKNDVFDISLGSGGRKVYDDERIDYSEGEWTCPECDIKCIVHAQGTKNIPVCTGHSCSLKGKEMKWSLKDLNDEFVSKKSVIKRLHSVLNPEKDVSFGKELAEVLEKEIERKIKDGDINEFIRSFVFHLIKSKMVLDEQVNNFRYELIFAQEERIKMYTRMRDFEDVIRDLQEQILDLEYMNNDGHQRKSKILNNTINVDGTSATNQNIVHKYYFSE